MNAYIGLIYLKPPFHQGLFFSNQPDLDRIVPNQSFDLPNGCPESPPKAQLFYDPIESRLYQRIKSTFLPARESHVPIIRAGACFCS